MVKFSIIVPVYNVEKYLRECIDSLINQTYKNIEIILIDDGSPDNSSKICDEYAEKDNRIKVIHKENGGVTSARKVGANSATGDYIVCVDADDWVEDTYLEEFVKAIEIDNSEVICCEDYIDNGTPKLYKPMSYKEGLYKREDIEKEIFPVLIEGADCRYFSNALWCKAVKTEFFVKNQILVDDGIRIGEDAAVIKPCIYEANSLYIIKKPLYYYRYNPSSATKGKKAFDWQEPKLRGEHFEKTIDMNEFDFKEQNYRMVVHALFNVAESQFNRKEKYSVIAKEIKENIKDEYYKTAIKNCNFKAKKGKLALFALKYKLILFIYLLNCKKKII